MDAPKTWGLQPREIKLYKSEKEPDAIHYHVGYFLVAGTQCLTPYRLKEEMFILTVGCRGFCLGWLVPRWGAMTEGHGRAGLLKVGMATGNRERSREEEGAPPPSYSTRPRLPSHTQL